MNDIGFLISVVKDISSSFFKLTWGFIPVNASIVDIVSFKKDL